MAYRDALAVLTAGIEPYSQNAAALVKTVQYFQPDAAIVVVDASGERTYPDLDHVVFADHKTGGYAEALNIAAYHSDAEWMVFVNTDVVCQGEFSRVLSGLQPGIYGNCMMRRDRLRPWLDGWIMAIHRVVWDTVGEFDDNFQAGAFEDADYCWRALDAGFPIASVGLPFVHLQKHTRYGNDGFWQKREDNWRYLLRKHGGAL